MSLRAIGRLRAGGGGAAAEPVDADAQAWADAVTLAGGTYAAGDLTALSAFITSAKANSYWTKLKCFGPLLGDQLTAALVQLKSGTWAPATNVNFVSGDYSRATGLTGNGTSKYLNTGFLADALTEDSTHVGVYVRSSTAAAGGVHIGAGNTAARIVGHFPYSDGNAYSDQYDIADGRLTVASLATPYGFCVGTRTAANSHTLYRNGSSIGSAATAGGSLGADNIFVFALNIGGTPSDWTSHPLGMYTVGDGLSGTDAANYNTDIQTLMTACGREV